MKRWLVFLACVLVSLAGHAGGVDKPQDQDKGRGIMAYGKADQDSPGWAVNTLLPDGWTGDCCLYAKAIGVNLVMYQGDWTGKPERVMVLNVWPSKLSSLEAELQQDRHEYFARDAAAKMVELTIDNKAMSCRGVHYEGTDHEDDLVVFCDPGLATGIRFSWSVTVAHDDPRMTELTALFQNVVEQSRYLKYTDETKGKDIKVKANP